jgi:hypothetical protein
MKKVDRRARDRRLSASVRNLRRQLKMAHAGVVVCAAVLYHQNVDHDTEIALVLDHLVGDRLREQIDRLNEIGAALRHRRSVTERRPS